MRGDVSHNVSLLRKTTRAITDLAQEWGLRRAAAGKAPAAAHPRRLGLTTCAIDRGGHPLPRSRFTSLPLPQPAEAGVLLPFVITRVDVEHGVEAYLVIVAGHPVRVDPRRYASACGSRTPLPCAEAGRAAIVIVGRAAAGGRRRPPPRRAPAPAAMPACICAVGCCDGRVRPEYR
jgi:hypothetical protein